MYTQEQLIEEQVKIELDMYNDGLYRFDKNNQRHIDAGNQSDTDWNRRLISTLVEPMAEGIRAYRDYYSKVNPETGKKRLGRPSKGLTLIKGMNEEQVAYIAIKIIFDALGNNKFDANYLVTLIGKKVEDQLRFDKLEMSAPKYIAKIKESLAKRNSIDYDHQHKVLVSSEKKLADRNAEKVAMGEESEITMHRWVSWAEEDCKHVGALLTDIFERTVTFENKPIIAKQVTGSGKAMRAYISPTEHVSNWIERYKEALGGLSPAFSPCVIPPRDWTSPTNGGYYTDKVAATLPLVKLRNKRHMRKLTARQMPEVYAAVNSLQRVRWAISERVLATANELVALGLPYALPSKNPSDWKERYPCPVPEHLADLKGDELKQALNPQQLEDFTEWKQVARQSYEEEQERVASVREVVSTLGQANTYVKYPALHFVYTLDFRGRVYCMGSRVSPQGGDLQKALIKFADGMALGAGGEYWFKVHGANEWGWDKKPMNERVANVSTPEFMTMCKDIADDPVTFNDWIHADKPWQFLNWCFEYADFLRFTESGGNPEDFVSYIPCAMDGSCSGIQHYSAMLRDKVGGAAVNLTYASDEGPQDIYGAVCKIVLKKLTDIANGYEQFEGKIDAATAIELAKEWLRLQPNRSLTKKPVMTLPYGSTQLTCREHVSQWLKDLQKEENKSAKAEFREPMKIHAFGDKTSSMPLIHAETFMSSLVWASIGEVVVAARTGMKYIKAITTSVAKANMPLEWTTPTGFVVRQEIYEMADRRIKTQLLGGTVFVKQEKTDKINYHRMVNSCAPNFVHSMDASHLVKATNAFVDAGISSIAVIHDSFGTHAGNTETLRKQLRASMVDMYTEHDVIRNFLSEVERKTLLDLSHIKIPEVGELDINEINQSIYAFA